MSQRNFATVYFQPYFKSNIVSNYHTANNSYFLLFQIWLIPTVCHFDIFLNSLNWLFYAFDLIIIVFM